MTVEQSRPPTRVSPELAAESRRPGSSFPRGDRFEKMTGILFETVVQEEGDYLHGMGERIDEGGVRLEIAVTGTVAKKAVKCGQRG